MQVPNLLNPLHILLSLLFILNYRYLLWIQLLWDFFEVIILLVIIVLAKIYSIFCSIAYIWIQILRGFLLHLNIEFLFNWFILIASIQEAGII